VGQQQYAATVSQQRATAAVAAAVAAMAGCMSSYALFTAGVCGEPWTSTTSTPCVLTLAGLCFHRAIACCCCAGLLNAGFILHEHGRRTVADLYARQWVSVW
jgi:hypothetical protein